MFIHMILHGWLREKGYCSTNNCSVAAARTRTDQPQTHFNIDQTNNRITLMVKGIPARVFKWPFDINSGTELFHLARDEKDRAGAHHMKIPFPSVN